MRNNPTTCTRTTETLSFWSGLGETAVYAPAAGVDAQLWYTLAPAMEYYFEDEWDGDYPYSRVFVRRVVRVAPDKYRVTLVEGYGSAPAVDYMLECDTDGSAYFYAA